MCIPVHLPWQPGYIDVHYINNGWIFSGLTSRYTQGSLLVWVKEKWASPMSLHPSPLLRSSKAPRIPPVDSMLGLTTFLSSPLYHLQLSWVARNRNPTNILTKSLFFPHVTRSLEITSTEWYTSSRKCPVLMLLLRLLLKHHSCVAFVFIFVRWQLLLCCPWHLCSKWEEEKKQKSVHFY